MTEDNTPQANVPAQDAPTPPVDESDPTPVETFEPTRLPAFWRIAARELTSVMTSWALGIETEEIAVRDQPLATFFAFIWSPLTW